MIRELSYLHSINALLTAVAHARLLRAQVNRGETDLFYRSVGLRISKLSQITAQDRRDGSHVLSGRWHVLYWAIQESESRLSDFRR